MGSYKIENKCVPKPDEKPKAAHEIDFNPNFLTNFFVLNHHIREFFYGIQLELVKLVQV